MQSVRSIAPMRAVRSTSSSPGAIGPRLPSKRAGTIARVAEVNQSTYEADVMQASLEKPVVVEFWATWCGPCKLVGPLMDMIDKEYQGSIKVVKIEHDANPELIEKYKVYGLPALILVKDGEFISGSKHEGAISKALLMEWLIKNGVPAPP